MDSEIYENLPPTKLFFRCVLPALLSSVVGALYSIADGFFVGRFIGREALAGINLVMPMIFICFALADMIAAGSSVQISIALGRHDRNAACKIFSSCTKLIFLLSVVIGAAGLLLAKPALSLFGAEPAVTDAALQYIYVYSLSSPFIILGFATDNYLRTCGRETQSMIIFAVTSVLNIALDVVLVVILRQGVWATAFTSCISMAVGSFWSLIPFLRKELDLRFVKGFISLKQFFAIAANGSSEFFTGIAASLSMLVINAVLINTGGTAAVAAHSILMYTDSVIGMMLFGVASAVQPSISYCYGARRYDRIKAIMYRVFIACGVLSVAALLFMLFCGNFILPLFIQDGDTQLFEVAEHAMKIFAFSYLCCWLSVCLSSLMTSLERPVRSLIISLSDTLVFPLICIYLLIPSLGLDGVWAAQIFSGILSSVLALAVTLLYIKSKRIKSGGENISN